MGLITNQAVIANNAALSGAIDLDGMIPVSIQMPASWTAAAITFQASSSPADFSREGVTTAAVFADLYDSTGTEVSVTAAASHVIALDATKFQGVRQIKVRSGTTGSPVNQGGARTLVVSARPEA